MTNYNSVSVSNAMKTAPAASNVNLEMQRYYAGQNYRESTGAAPAPGPGWPGAVPYEAAIPGMWTCTCLMCILCNCAYLRCLFTVILVVVTCSFMALALHFTVSKFPHLYHIN